MILNEVCFSFSFFGFPGRWRSQTDDIPCRSRANPHLRLWMGRFRIGEIAGYQVLPACGCHTADLLCVHPLARVNRCWNSGISDRDGVQPDHLAGGADPTWVGR